MRVLVTVAVVAGGGEPPGMAAARIAQVKRIIKLRVIVVNIVVIDGSC